MINRSYLLELSDGTAWICRVDLDGGRKKLAQEAAVYRWLWTRAPDLPIATAYHLDQTRDLIPHEYALLPRLPGTNLGADVEYLPGEIREPLLVQVGGLLLVLDSMGTRMTSYRPPRTMGFKLVTTSVSVGARLYRIIPTGSRYGRISPRWVFSYMLRPSQPVSETSGPMSAIGDGLFLLIMLLATPCLTWAAELPNWDFRDARVPLWQAERTEVNLNRTSDGMVVAGLGPWAFLVGPEVVFAAHEAAYVRVRVRSPRPIQGTYLGWSFIDEALHEDAAAVEVTLPKLIPGRAGTLWVPVGHSPKWVGQIRRLSLGIPGEGPMTKRSMTIESIAVFAPTPWTRAQVAWTELDLDRIAEHMALPLWSLNSIEPVRVGQWTLHQYASVMATLGLLALWVSRSIRMPRLSRVAKWTGWGILGPLITVLMGLALYLGYSSWRIEQAVFQGRSPVEAYRYLDGFDLAGVADEIKRILPVGTSVRLCSSVSDERQGFITNRARYQFFPITVEPRGAYLLVFSQEPGICETPPGDLVVERPIYSLYRVR